ncbi:MAG: 3-hydroxyacyl-CoA dehydrogenase NAD-binding domain-containing protein [Pseudomonadota bacterium]|nr:3-hydroxyacyl-CoA dehydrogenase NAD-binding domain-containing protein [Pseudomonadota bacterium]
MTPWLAGERRSGCGDTKAKALGLIDEIDPDPLFFAETTNPEWLGMQVPVGERNVNPPAADAFDTARATAKRKMPGQTAPLVAIDLLDAVQSLPLAQGLAQEREAFINLRTGEQATALRHVFFGEWAAKAPDWLADAIPKELTRIAVAGGGTMGAGIAYALLSAGYSVVVLETDPDGVARAQKNLDALFASGRKRGLLDETGEQSRRAALAVSDDYAQAAQAGLAIEAAFESMDVKHRVLGKFEAVLPPEAVLATNTSYLDIDVMAAKLSDPTRLVGLHFFAPAHIMKLLEIVRGARTSDTALKTGFALAKTLKKVPVLSGVCDGFIGNRILARYREAADTLLMDGATPAEVDAAVVAFGYSMGPYEAQDMSGLDIAHANRRRQDVTRDPDRRYIPIGDRLVDMGRLGKKTGSGWYDYGTGAKQPDDAVVEVILAEAQRENVTRRAFSADDIQHRLLLAMINEAADILNEGIAAQALNIDLVTVFGYGFPRWRGGLMNYADTLGPQKVLAGLQALAAEDPKVWTPSPMIQDAEVL